MDEPHVLGRLKKRVSLDMRVFLPSDTECGIKLSLKRANSLMGVGAAFERRQPRVAEMVTLVNNDVPIEP
jgi:hypothetical protein